MNNTEKKNDRFEAKGVKVENKPDSNWNSILKKYEDSSKTDNKK